MNPKIKQWEDPPKRYRANPMIHEMPGKNRTVLMDAVKDFGFGGVVTNPSWENWYEGYERNVSEFADVLRELEERDLSFWIYDEKGYPSGAAGGEVLRGHPELEAKGFYMRRMVAYEPRHVKFQLDCESDKIVWAARYPMDCTSLNDAFVLYDRMTAVPFSESVCEADLGEKEAMYVFGVKPSYEGTHLTHISYSYLRYINVMNPAAVRRFIDVMLEPIARAIPDAFSRATAVFTDEPALYLGYSKDYERWPYAMAPWCDDLFERYEKEYGQSLLPYLPLLFEGGTNAYPYRINFYRLVGKIVADSYVQQMRKWVGEHGGVFSGHYLGEEHILGHVKDYGSYIEVASSTDYPGLDVLTCHPEGFNYDTVKYPQMVARKMGASGIMAELCPFYDVETFAKDPVNNMISVVGTLYMYGVRICNSYFTSNFEEYAPDKLADRKGYMSREEARFFNNYVGRLGWMMDGAVNDCTTFVYYGIEDSAAKFMPECHPVNDGPAAEVQYATNGFTRKLLEQGNDFYYADRDDLVAAADCSIPTISGHRVERVIIPSVDVLYDESYQALRLLQEKGVKVCFLEKIPGFGSSEPVRKTDRTEFTPYAPEQILEEMKQQDDGLKLHCGDFTVLKARYAKGNRRLWMLNNINRCDVEVSATLTENQTAKVFNPDDGSILPYQNEKYITIPALRALFLVIDKEELL